MLRIQNRVFWSDSDPVPIPVFKIRSDLDSIFKIRSDPDPGKNCPESATQDLGDRERMLQPGFTAYF